jgi:hypothetical protein
MKHGDDIKILSLLLVPPLFIFVPLHVVVYYCDRHGCWNTGTLQAQREKVSCCTLFKRQNIKY